MADDFKTHVLAPKDIPKEWLHQLLNLILVGGQVSEDYAKRGMERAKLIAFATYEDEIVSMAVMKNPLDSYRDKLFREAKVGELPVNYSLELGYMVTKPEFEGRKLCQRLIALIIPDFQSQMIFATTRKPAMIHILKKHGFETIGQQYGESLNLLVYKGHYE